MNSYRRLVPESDAPTNVHWAIDNRTVSLARAVSDPANLRVENRVPGADSNPYLAFAASLACGYLGMIERIKPSEPVTVRPIAMPTRCRSASMRRSTS